MKEVAGATTGSQRLAINGRADMKEKKGRQGNGRDFVHIIAAKVHGTLCRYQDSCALTWKTCRRAIDSVLR